MSSLWSPPCFKLQVIPTTLRKGQNDGVIVREGGCSGLGAGGQVLGIRD